MKVSTLNDNDELQFLAEQLTQEIVPSGGTSEEYRFAIHPDAIENKTLFVEVDAGDFVSECSEGNNTVVLTDVSCDDAYAPVLEPRN